MLGADCDTLVDRLAVILGALGWGIGLLTGWVLGRHCSSR
jgi:short subunit fatty acids transporter